MTAGRIIGRTACPLCDHEAAHVKQSEGKLPYVHCPECGCTLPTRNGVQAGHLRRKTRADKLAHLSPGADGVHVPQPPSSGNDIVLRDDPPAAPTTTTTTAPAAAPAAPAKPAKRASPWAPLIGAIK